MTQHNSVQTPLQVKLCSLNIRGLNTPNKRTQLLYTLQKTKVHIVFLQETHFRSDNIPKLHNNFFPQFYHASKVDSKTKGVSILISKHCPIQILEVQRDTNGRYLFLKGSIHNRPITLANLYAPNKQQVPFFRKTLQLLTSFQNGILIVGGDFNVALSPPQDTSTGTSSITYRALRAIKTQLSDLTLHNTWRMLHPKDKDFTFFSPPHGKYSRIDYFYLSQNDLSLLTKATIDPILLSDHNPISMTLTFPTTRTASTIWRLDNSLLTDLEISQTIAKRLSQYFKEKHFSGFLACYTVGSTQMCYQRGPNFPSRQKI